MADSKSRKVAIVTGSAGFIGYHVSNKLLSMGWRVVGVDSMSDYYDVSLKKQREDILLRNANYRSVHKKIEAKGLLLDLFQNEKPEIVIHLAAQAGVRNSIKNPRDYLESNILGTFELLEAARTFSPKHILLASTSSAYGANEKMPYKESDKADYQLSFYAATKKSTENMAHSYSHLFNMPISVFRFFTVYGPWGRPDMALFKFTKAILSGEPIQVYNYGKMMRDFTYIDDLVDGIMLLIDAIPEVSQLEENSSWLTQVQSPVAPFRIVNIGNSKPEKLTDLIKAIEEELGLLAQKNLLPIQAGDVPSTWAETKVLERLTGFRPKTELSEGVANFVKWYREYYRV